MSKHKDRAPTKPVPAIGTILPPSNISIYRNLKGEKKPKEVAGLTSSTVLPTEKDYEKGFFKRFFIARYDSPTASEVTQDFYKKKFKKLAKDLYKSVEIRWYLKDNVNFDRRTVLKQITAHNMNEDEIAYQSKYVPQLKDTIKDFSQFVG